MCIKKCIKYQKLDDRPSIPNLSQMSESINMLCSVCDAFKCGAFKSEVKKVEKCNFWHRVPETHGREEFSDRKRQNLIICGLFKQQKSYFTVGLHFS